MMRRAFLLATMIATLTAARAVPVPAQAAQQVSCQPNSTGTASICRIDEPIVTQRVTAYPTILFRPGDAVSVAAGGCVQTGGAGRTWKRYVNPDNSTFLSNYYGEIWVPGLTPGLVRLSSTIGQTRVIPPGSSQNGSYLRLGYVDDHYGDNGYYAHDDGTGDQCRNVGAAYVIITIVHNAASQPNQSTAPFDLMWTATDANGLPVSPAWNVQLAHGSWYLPSADATCNGFRSSSPLGNPPCSAQQPTFDGPSATSLGATTCTIGRGTPINGRFPGHVNWFNATYTGRLFWEGHSATWPFGDDDYNLRLLPQDDNGDSIPNGMTDGNIEGNDPPTDVPGRTTLGLEFQAGEATDHFTSGWWDQFHKAVDKTKYGWDALAMLGGKAGLPASVIGLVGLDAEHSPIHTELHPVFALAIHTNASPTDDTWAIFVRNWGNEGWCSQYQHYLDGSPITVFLPEKGASYASITAATFFQTNNSAVSGPRVAVVPGRGIQASFAFPAPEQGAFVYGELHLRDVPPSPQPAVSVVPAGPLPVGHAVTVRVVATDPRTRAPINGTVTINNYDTLNRPITLQEPTNVPFTVTFNVKRTPHRTCDTSVRPPQCYTETDVTEPSGTVSAPGYATARIPFTFATPLAERHRSAVRPALPGGNQPDGEDLAARLEAPLPAAKRQVIAAAVRPSSHVSSLHAVPGLVFGPSPLPSLPAHTKARYGVDTVRAQVDNKTHAALCSAYNNHLPTYPGYC